MTGVSAEAIQARLPDGTHLAYSIYHEASWWAGLPVGARPNQGRPTVQVFASAKGAGGGVAWEFGVQHYNHHHPEVALRVEVFSDAWHAFAQIPEFFDALAADKVKTLDDVIALLQQLGAVDETTRLVTR